MSAARRPPHLLLCPHPAMQQPLHGALRWRRGERLVVQSRRRVINDQTADLPPRFSSPPSLRRPPGCAGSGGAPARSGHAKDASGCVRPHRRSAHRPNGRGPWRPASRWRIERRAGRASPGGTMCGRPLGFKSVSDNFDERIDCDHVFGLLTRRHDRWPRWSSRSGPKQSSGFREPLVPTGCPDRRFDRSSSHSALSPRHRRALRQTG
jgi:hypothetical protein